MIELIEKVKLLHEKNNFKNNGGEDKLYRMALIMEEVGEICEVITKNRGDIGKEHADLLILLLGNCVAYGIDIVKLANQKLDEILDLESTVTDNYARIITTKSEKDLEY